MSSRAMITVPLPSSPAVAGSSYSTSRGNGSGRCWNPCSGGKLHLSQPRKGLKATVRAKARGGGPLTASVEVVVVVDVSRCVCGTVYEDCANNMVDTLYEGESAFPRELCTTSSTPCPNSTTNESTNQL